MSTFVGCVLLECSALMLAPEFHILYKIVAYLRVLYNSYHSKGDNLTIAFLTMTLSEAMTPRSLMAILETPRHPFFPSSIDVPGYVPTSVPTIVLLTIFFGSLGAIVTSTKLAIKRCQPALSKGDVWTASWFILCGCIHTFFEGMSLPSNSCMMKAPTNERH